MIFAVLLLLLLALTGCYTESKPRMFATHDIPYASTIQENDVEVAYVHWYTSHSAVEHLRTAIIGHITVRHIQKGEPVQNPGDVLPFAGHPKN